MSPHPVNPPDWPASTSPISAAYRAGELVFLSGQVAPTDGTFEEEVGSVLDEIERVLRAAGAGLDHLVKVNVFLAHASFYEVFNTIYSTRFGSHKPARATVVVGFPNPRIRIEIEAVAHLDR